MAITEVVVPSSVTVSVAIGDVDRSKLASPEYTAWTNTRRGAGIE